MDAENDSQQSLQAPRLDPAVSTALSEMKKEFQTQQQMFQLQMQQMFSAQMQQMIQLMNQPVRSPADILQEVATPPAHQPTKREIFPPISAPASFIYQAGTEMESYQEDNPLRSLLTAVDTSSEGLCRAFTSQIRNAPIPARLRCPTLSKYEGIGDPLDHLATFLDDMVLTHVFYELMCRLFVSTLIKTARGWFTRLPSGCIRCFAGMKKIFLSHYATSKKPVKSAACLFSLFQEEIETLRAYVTRFIKISHEVEDNDAWVTRMALGRGLKQCPFKWSLTKNPASSLADFLKRAEKFINAEETVAAEAAEVKRNIYKVNSSTHVPKELKSYQSAKMIQAYQDPKKKFKKNQRQSNQTAPIQAQYFQPAQRPPRPFTIDEQLPVFNCSLSEIVCAIQGKPYFARPLPLKLPAGQRDTSKFCLYHGEPGHLTENFHALKTLLVRLFNEGKLDDFIPKFRPPLRKGNQREEGRSAANPQPINLQVNRVSRGGLPILDRIDVITGGAGKGASRQCILHYVNMQELMIVQKPSLAISFSDCDLPLVENTFNDAVIIEAVINDREVRRILVDTGASVNVLTGRIVPKLGVLPNSLRPPMGTLVGFAGERRVLEGVVTLTVTLGILAGSVSQPVEFMVLDSPVGYNAIFGRPLLNAFKAVVSTAHLAIKFPSATKVITARGDLGTARQCYINTMKEDIPMG